MTEAIPQQFVTDPGEPETPLADPTTGQEVEPRDGERSGRRGRPRSQEAIARDEAVYAQLTNGAQLTRNEIAEAVSQPGGLTYLSLYRLKRENRVVRVSDGSTRRAWRQVTAEDAQPITETSETPTPAEG